MKARVVIVLLNWNGWRDTLECLGSLLKLTHTSFAVVVVDNCSADNSVSEIKEWAESSVKHKDGFGRFFCVDFQGALAYQKDILGRDLILIRAPQNGGFAYGNNIGLRLGVQCGAQSLWLLNNDTVVEENSLIALELTASTHRAVGMVGSMLCYFDDREVIQVLGGVVFNKWNARGRQLANGVRLNEFRREKYERVPVDYLAGASIFLKVDFIRDVGYMSEEYFLYFEEMDWSWRATKKEWCIATAVDSIVFHKEGASIGTDSRKDRSLISQFYLNRNLILFYFKNWPFLLPIAIARVLRECVRCIFVGDMRRARVTFQAFVCGIAGQRGKYDV